MTDGVLAFIRQPEVRSVKLKSGFGADIHSHITLSLHMFGLLLEKGLAADRFQVELEQNLTKASLHVAQYDHRKYHRQFGLKDVIN